MTGKGRCSFKTSRTQIWRLLLIWRQIIGMEFMVCMEHGNVGAVQVIVQHACLSRIDLHDVFSFDSLLSSLVNLSEGCSPSYASSTRHGGTHYRIDCFNL